MKERSLLECLEDLIQRLIITHNKTILDSDRKTLKEEIDSLNTLLEMFKLFKETKF